MGKKEATTIPMPDDLGHSFAEEDFVLNYRPNIDFVEPDQVNLDAIPDRAIPVEEEQTIDNLRDRAQKLINGYNAVTQLAEQTQERIDERVGDLSIKLDAVKDALAIAAVQRRFPDKADPTVITYDDYRACLDAMRRNAPMVPQVDNSEIRAAKSDPTRTDFGGLSNQQGENRAEISSPASSIKPLDLDAFQSAGILALFALLLPLVKQQDELSIAQHLATAKHV